MNFYISEPFRVRFSETDMAGVVHFSQILRWAENAEGEFFRHLGIPFVERSGEMLTGWPRVRIQADFLAPARYNDCIRVRIRPQTLADEKTSALTWEFEVVCIKEESEQIIARGRWTSVYANINPTNGKLCAGKGIPESLKNILKNS